MEIRPVLDVRHVTKAYKKGRKSVDALSDVSFTLLPGEILGIVGESGSGKSTLLRQIACLENATSGQIVLDDTDITRMRTKDICRSIQMVFQDAVASFDPHMKISASIGEALAKLCGIRDRKTKTARISELIGLVGMNEELADRYPEHLSGGQCQRMAIARSIAVSPRVLLCDEVTSALDVSAQAQIVGLLANLRDRLGISIIFVSHDLALISSICDRVIVMKNGRCVEQGVTESVITTPSEEYTKLLLSSVLTLDVLREKNCKEV